jgi:hypothetical protein
VNVDWLGITPEFSAACVCFFARSSNMVVATQVEPWPTFTGPDWDILSPRQRAECRQRAFDERYWVVEDELGRFDIYPGETPDSKAFIEGVMFVEINPSPVLLHRHRERIEEAILSTLRSIAAGEWEIDFDHAFATGEETIARLVH